VRRKPELQRAPQRHALQTSMSGRFWPLRRRSRTRLIRPSCLRIGLISKTTRSSRSPHPLGNTDGASVSLSRPAGEGAREP
jgi:hypothetical protein